MELKINISEFYKTERHLADTDREKRGVPYEELFDETRSFFDHYEPPMDGTERKLIYAGTKILENLFR